MKNVCGVVTVRYGDRLWKNVVPTIFKTWIDAHLTGHYWDIYDEKTGRVTQRSYEIEGNPLMVNFLYLATEDYFLKDGHKEVLTKK